MDRNGPNSRTIPLGLPNFLTLAPAKGAHHRFSLHAASRPLCKSKLSRAGPLGVGVAGQMSLLLGEWHGLSSQGVRMASPQP